VLQEFEAPTDSRQSAHDGGKVVRYTSAAFTPGDIPGTHLCQRLSRPQGHSAAGGIMSMTTSGIEPATFRFVAQCLSRLRHHGSHLRKLNKGQNNNMNCRIEILLIRGKFKYLGTTLTIKTGCMKKLERD
jgi:hypothetical protein